jgi:hypothetical protein
MALCYDAPVTLRPAGPMNRNDALLADWHSRALHLEEHVKRAVIGQDRVARLVNVAVFARGHVLLEGDVGVGKTTLLRAFARGIGGDYERVEGTVDLMPADLPCGSEAGLGVFTEYRSFLLLAPVEVCSGYAALLATLERLDWRMGWAGASLVGKGLHCGLELARALEPRPALVLLTDGHEAPRWTR